MRKLNDAIGDRFTKLEYIPRHTVPIVSNSPALAASNMSDNTVYNNMGRYPVVIVKEARAEGEGEGSATVTSVAWPRTVMFSGPVMQQPATAGAGAPQLVSAGHSFLVFSEL